MKAEADAFLQESLNDTLLPIIENNPPPALKGKYIRIKFWHTIAYSLPAVCIFLQPASVC